MTIPDADSFVTTHPHPFEDDGTTRDRCGVKPNPATWVQCGFAREHHRWPCSPTCTHDDAWTPGHPERVKERSEAFAEAADAAAGLVARDRGLQHAYDNGADAMRAACWEAVQGQLQALGFYAGSPAWNVLKAAIEGATP